MSFYADIVADGIKPLRHHAKDFDPAARAVMFGCRIGGPDETGGAPWGGEGVDKYGRFKGESVDRGGTEDTHGDILGAGLWARQPGAPNDRTIPGWNWAWPAVTTGSTFGIMQPPPAAATTFSPPATTTGGAAGGGSAAGGSGGAGGPGTGGVAASGGGAVVNPPTSQPFTQTILSQPPPSYFQQPGSVTIIH